MTGRGGLRRGTPRRSGAVPTAVRGVRRPSRPVGLLVLLAIVLLVVAVAAAGSGAFRVPLGEVAGSVGHRLGLGGAPVTDPVGESVLWQVRFPRVALAVVVGAALGIAGAVMQGIFGNPLAEPGIVGVSAGAAVGAAAATIAAGSLGGAAAATGAAFVAGAGTTLLVYLAARRDGRTEVVTLVLTGIAVNALGGALLGALLFVADDAQLRAITFWTLGSVGAATWPAVAAVAPCLLVGAVVAQRSARSLDLLALGEPTARHLGVDVERTRLTMIAVVALLTAAAVAVAGIVSFVGLVVPHTIRLLIGPGHRWLLPASALAGGLVLVLADLVARTVAAPAELPLGVLTAAIGAPYFLWLLRRTRARHGAWA